MITPILLDKSAFGAYFLFGALALGTVAVLAVYMPETRGRSLENIQEAFHHPPSASRFVRSLAPLRRRTATQTPPAAEDQSVELASRRFEGADVNVTSSARSLTNSLRVDIAA